MLRERMTRAAEIQERGRQEGLVAGRLGRVHPPFVVVLGAAKVLHAREDRPEVHQRRGDPCPVVPRELDLVRCPPRGEPGPDVAALECARSGRVERAAREREPAGAARVSGRRRGTPRSAPRRGGQVPCGTPRGRPPSGRRRRLPFATPRTQAGVSRPRAARPARTRRPHRVRRGRTGHRQRATGPAGPGLRGRAADPYRLPVPKPPPGPRPARAWAARCATPVVRSRPPRAARRQRRCDASQSGSPQSCHAAQ